jgi:hypothetical protein
MVVGVVVAGANSAAQPQLAALAALEFALF